MVPPFRQAFGTSSAMQPAGAEDWNMVPAFHLSGRGCNQRRGEDWSLAPARTGTGFLHSAGRRSRRGVVGEDCGEVGGTGFHHLPGILVHQTLPDHARQSAGQGWGPSGGYLDE